MKDSDVSVEKIVNDGLSNITVNALTLILRKFSLPRGYHSRPEIVKNIVKYIQDGKLDIDIFLEEIRLIQECSSKVIYLCKIIDKSILKDVPKLEKLLNEKLPSPKGEQKKTLLLPEKPTLNYYEIANDEVRLKFSETHINVKFSIAKRDFEDIKHTNVIVFSVNLKTGNAKIYLDTPWNVHPYPNVSGNCTKDSYFNYHLNRFHHLFGEFLTTNLTQKISDLIHQTQSVCFPKLDAGINDANNKRTLSGENLINDDEYRSLKYDRIIEYTNLNFLANRSQGNLLDDINVVVHPIEGRIHIQAERLASEVDYVISAITKI